MVNLFGPGAFGSARPAAVRPSFTPENAPGDQDDWFKDCSSPEARDGTEWRSGWLNGLIANLRGVVRKSGHTASNLDDDLLTRSIRKGFWYVPAIGGSATGLTATLDPAIADYSQIVGATFVLVPASAAQAGGTTLALNGLSALPLTFADGTPVEANSWVSGERVHVVAAASAFVITGISPAKVRSIVSASLGALQTFGGRQVVFGSGSGSWTVPAGVTSIFVKMNGAGAGGGGAFTAGSTPAAGVGGGGGEYAEGAFTVTPGQVLSYSVPGASAGGAGSATPTAGSNGGTATFGGLISAAGGVGGSAGLDGVASSGGSGGNGGSGGGRRLAGGGGGFGVVPASTSAQGGQGGHSPFGGPGTSPNINAAGTIGNGPGGGGAGGGAISGGANGGNGAAGTLVIQY